MTIKNFQLKDTEFARVLVFINCAVPCMLLAVDLATGRLGANPLDFITEATGTLALVFLMLTLTLTPLRKLTGWNWLVKFRRTIGLYAFFYLMLHFLTYLGFDKSFNVVEAGRDAVQRPFIFVGLAALLLMIPLAVTSTNNMIKRLGGKRWNKLHKLTYVCAALGVLHYFLLVKSDTTKPLMYFGVLVALLGYRAYKAYLPDARTSSPVPRR